MTTRILVVQQVPFMSLGTFRPLLEAAGLTLQPVIASARAGLNPELPENTGLIVMSGPVQVSDLTRLGYLETERALIRQALDRREPLLCVGFGAQLLASEMGAKVYEDAAPPPGWVDAIPSAEGRADPAFRSMTGLFKVLNWHSDTFDLPSGAVRLVSAPRLPNLAFRVGTRAYGLQCHMECNADTIESWIASRPTPDPDSIRRDLPEADYLARLAGDFVSGWLRGTGLTG